MIDLIVFQVFSARLSQAVAVISCTLHEGIQQSTLDTVILCLATLTENVIYCILMKIMSATIDFKLFPFQIGASNAVVVPVHHSSFGPSPLTRQL